MQRIASCKLADNGVSSIGESSDLERYPPGQFKLSSTRGVLGLFFFGIRERWEVFVFSWSVFQYSFSFVVASNGHLVFAQLAIASMGKYVGSFLSQMEIYRLWSRFSYCYCCNAICLH